MWEMCGGANVGAPHCHTCTDGHTQHSGAAAVPQQIFAGLQVCPSCRKPIIASLGTWVLLPPTAKQWEICRLHQTSLGAASVCVLLVFQWDAVLQFQSCPGLIVLSCY